MASFNISPGLNTINAKLNSTDGAGRDVAAGDVATLLAGTYTFNTFALLMDHAGLGTAAAVTGPPDTLIIQGIDRDTVILDFAGCVGATAIYGGDFTGVTIKNMTFKNCPSGGGAFIRDAANLYKDWTFDNIKLDGNFVVSTNESGNQGQAPTPFKLGYAGNMGTGIKFKNIVTTSTFGGVVDPLYDGTDTHPQRAQYTPSVFDIRVQNASGIDLTIDGVDCTLNNGYVKRAVYGENFKESYVRNIKAANLWGGAVRIESVAAVQASGNVQLSISNVYLDNGWDGSATTFRHRAGVAEPGIHVGNPAADAANPTRVAHISNAIIKNNASYGIEFENDVQYSSVVDFYIYNCKEEGVPLAEETQHNTVSDGTIDTIHGTSANGVTMAHSAYNKVARVTISNCNNAINHQDSAVGFTLLNVKNEVSDCTFIGCTTGYYVTAASLNSAGPAEDSAGASAFFNNKFYNVTNYALVDDVAKTQAQFVALFPHTVKASDTVTAGTPNYSAYSVQECLNMMAGQTDLHAYSIQKALNVIVASTAYPNAVSAQKALNQLVVR